MRNRVPRRPARSARCRPAVEGLESRRVMAVTFGSTFVPFKPPEVQVDTSGVTANALALGADGALWFTLPSDESYTTQAAPIGRLDPTTGVITRYQTPSFTAMKTITPPFGSPFDVLAYNKIATQSMIAGPGGKLWFVETRTTTFDYYQYNLEEIDTLIASIDPATGVVAEFPVGVVQQSTNSTTGVFPVAIAHGSDGNLWFTDAKRAAVGVFNPTTLATAEFPLPDSDDVPGQFIAGPGGDLSFTAFVKASHVSAIGQIDPASHELTLASLPSLSFTPVAIAAGSDGNVWFNEVNGGTTRIASYDPATRAIVENAGGGRGGITTGSDGDLWYTTGTGTLTRFDPVTHLATPFPLPDGLTVPVGGPTVVSGPGDALSFVANNYLSVATIVPATGAAITGSIRLDPTGSGTSTTRPGYLEVYLDLDDDGIVDPGEPTTRTDDTGRYAFTGLVPGSYTVRIAPSGGTVVTSPAGSEAGQLVTVAAGEAGQAGVFGVVPAGAIVPIAFVAAPFGAANPDVQTALVVGLYRLILGRDAEPEGRANAIAYLKGGGNLAQLAGDLITSVESDLNLVKAYYGELLHRAPTPAERDYQVGILRGGMSPEGLFAAILDSAEYGTLHVADADFVEALYHDVLGRPSDSPGKAHWVGGRGVGLSRTDLVRAFLDSTEAVNRAIRGQFNLILARPVDNANLSLYFNQLRYGGRTQRSLAIELLAGTEFATRADATVSGV